MTGAAGGIGRAIARAFAAEGIAVAAVRYAARRARRTRGFGFIGMDVADRAAVVAGLDAAEAAFGGPIDMLVNCAGLYPCDPLLEMTEAAWDRVLDVNVKGTFLTSQECCRRLVAAGMGGCDRRAHHLRRLRAGASPAPPTTARPRRRPRCSTRCFALEFRRASHPGERGLAGLRGGRERGEPCARRTSGRSRAGPRRRPGEGADIARAVLFLCSEAAEWVTGASWRVERRLAGGLSGVPRAGASCRP